MTNKNRLIMGDRSAPRGLRRWRRGIFALLASLAASVAGAASLEFFVNASSDYDFGRQLTLPSGFGAGEFTLELWVRPNDSFPVGSTAGGAGKLQNWSSADVAPYSSDTWWYLGNFLLDGHNNGDFRNGTFSLQFYGGGRVRWLFGDGTSPPGGGGVWSVGSYPATDSPSLLDGNWHQVTLVRRWIGMGTQAQLELWIDGTLIALEVVGSRVNMRQWWDGWAGFPGDQRGWFWGGEKFAVNGGADWEDYKGLVDELRFWSRAKTTQEIQSSYAAPVTGTEPGLVGRYAFGEMQGLSTCNSLALSECIQLTATSSRPDPAMWSSDNAPLSGVSDSQAPSVPTGLQGTAVSTSRIDLGWDAATDNVAVAGYRVRRNGTIVGTPASTTFSDTGLAPNTAYSYTVAAYDAAGNESSQSQAINVTTPVVADTQAPTTPASLRGTAISTSRIDLDWDASTDNVAVAGYRVRRNGTIVGTPASTTFSDTGLAPNTAYSYTVAAYDAAGNESSQSQAINVTTPVVADTQAPTTPASLRGTAISTSRIDLDWGAATDNVGVAGYRVRRGGSVVATTSTTSYSDTGLAPNTTYAYSVSAFDAAGNESGQSTTLNVITQAVSPPPSSGGGGGGGSIGFVEILCLLLACVPRLLGKP